MQEEKEPSLPHTLTGETFFMGRHRIFLTGVLTVQDCQLHLSDLKSHKPRIPVIPNYPDPLNERQPNISIFHTYSPASGSANGCWKFAGTAQCKTRAQGTQAFQTTPAETIQTEQTSSLYLQGKNFHKSRVVPDANSYALRKYRKSTKSAFCPNSHLMADNRLTAELRGCVEAFLEYIPHVSWLRECSVLYQANQLCSP